MANVDLYLTFLTLLYRRAILLVLLITGKMVLVKLFYCQCSKFKTLETLSQQAPPHVAHNNNTNSGSGKWEGKQSGRRKGLPKKLGAPRTPINDIAEELRQRSVVIPI